METLHALLIRPYPGQSDEISRQLGLLIERLPSFPELLVARFFRSHGEAHTYLVFTTWNPEARDPLAEDPGEPPPKGLEVQRQERMFRLALPVRPEGETEEWLLRYIWGYSHSGLEARHGAAIIVNNPNGLEQQIRQRWIAGLRALAAETSVGQIFLARSLPSSHGEDNTSLSFLCYLGCPSEEELGALRAHPYYEGILSWLSRFAQVRVLEVAPLFPDYRAPA